MILGGRYLQETMSSSVMGMPFEGMGLLGYDNLRKQYTGVWLDNMSTQITSYSGTYDVKAKAFLMTSESIDAVSGEMMHSRMVTTLVDKNKHIFEVFSPGPDGKEIKNMEIIYERQ
jgi:hypothetical protein